MYVESPRLDATISWVGHVIDDEKMEVVEIPDRSKVCWSSNGSVAASMPHWEQFHYTIIFAKCNTQKSCMTDLSFCANLCQRKQHPDQCAVRSAVSSNDKGSVVLHCPSSTLIDAFEKQFDVVHTWILRATFYWQHSRQFRADFSTIWPGCNNNCWAASCSW